MKGSRKLAFLLAIIIGGAFFVAPAFLGASPPPALRRLAPPTSRPPLSRSVGLMPRR